MASKGYRKWAPIIPVVVLLVAAGAWLAHHKAMQDRLDREFFGAVKQYDAAKVILCLNRGADPNVRDGGQIPFYWWIMRTFKREPTWDTDAPTPLMFIFSDTIVADRRSAHGSTGHIRPEPTQIVKALLDNGAKADINLYKGWPLIIYPASDGYANCLRMMLDRGASPNAQCLNGSVLSHAIGSGNAACVRTLIDHGADVNAKEPDGRSPLKLAEQARATPEIIATLKKSGAK